jgi:hypothetical protein
MNAWETLAVDDGRPDAWWPIEHDGEQWEVFAPSQSVADIWWRAWLNYGHSADEWVRPAGNVVPWAIGRPVSVT